MRSILGWVLLAVIAAAGAVVGLRPGVDPSFGVGCIVVIVVCAATADIITTIERSQR